MTRVIIGSRIPAPGLHLFRQPELSGEVLLVRSRLKSKRFSGAIFPWLFAREHAHAGLESKAEAHFPGFRFAHAGLKPLHYESRASTGKAFIMDGK